MAERQNSKWEEMDKSNVDLTVLKQHFYVHNRTEGKPPTTVGWYTPFPCDARSQTRGHFLPHDRWIPTKSLSEFLNKI